MSEITIKDLLSKATQAELIDIYLEEHRLYLQANGKIEQYETYLASAKAEIAESNKQIAELFDYMKVTAFELKCLPSYASPSPTDGNQHIIRQIRKIVAENEQLKKQVAKLQGIVNIM